MALSGSEGESVDELEEGPDEMHEAEGKIVNETENADARDNKSLRNSTDSLRKEKIDATSFHTHFAILSICISTWMGIAYGLSSGKIIDTQVAQFVGALSLGFLLVFLCFFDGEGGAQATRSVPPSGFYLQFVQSKNKVKNKDGMKRKKKSNKQIAAKEKTDELAASFVQSQHEEEKIGHPQATNDGASAMEVEPPVAADIGVPLPGTDVFPLPCSEQERVGTVHNLDDYPPDGAGKPLPPMPARIIVAEGGNFEDAVNRWRSIVDWRRKHKVDGILEEPQPHFKHIKDCYSHFFHKLDKTGRYYCYYLQPGKCDMDALAARGVNMDDLVRHNIFCLSSCGVLLIRMRRASSSP